jgi:FkbM family methyltransferase
MKHKPLTAKRIARRFLRPGDAVLEIGAADGEHTRIYADRVGPEGYVLAVEPHRDLHLLRSAVGPMPWVTIRQAAVGATAGQRPFYTNRSNPKRSALCRANVGLVDDTYPVIVTTVDACAAAMPRAPRVIQIDAQGAEFEILLGATKTLQLPCVWVIELWARGLVQAGGSVSAVLDLFQAHAFTPRSLLGTRLGWDEALDVAASRQGSGHVDYVMVPEDLMEADW